MLKSRALTSLWLWSLDEQSQADEHARYIWQFSASERARLNRITAKKRQREYIIGHYLLHQALNSYCPDWQHANHILHPSDSFPRLVGPLAKQFHFNLSHSHSLIACLVSTIGPVGLDVERVYRQRSLIDIAGLYFAGDEANSLMALPAAEQEPAFYRLWTLKESYIKAQQTSIADAGMQQRFVNDSDARNQRNGAWSHYSVVYQAAYFGFCLSQPIDQLLIYHLAEQSIREERIALDKTCAFAPAAEVG